MICFKCMGSGWSCKYPAGLINKECFIYIPCIECKGKGVADDGPRPSGQTSEEDKKG